MNALLGSLSLVDQSGQFIILAILLVLISALVANAVVRLKYRQLEVDLRDAVPHQPFTANVLNRIFHDAQSAARARGGDLEAQGIVEHRFGTELGGLLVAERFVKSAPGLVIVLGLVGTFYGLTLSIGRLASLVSADTSDVTAMTSALTSGLTQALAGMSVAFTTSLVGIAAAVLLTLLGVFFNVPDRRTGLMVHIENFIDRVLVPQFTLAGQGGSERISQLPAAPGTGIEQAVQGFAQCVARLESSVEKFDASLQTFAGSTRDFQQFNHHLKDNVQRMSLTFSDLSETLKAEATRQARRNSP